MDDLNYNEELDNMLSENSVTLHNKKALNTAKLIEMFFVKTTMLISNSKSTKFTNLDEESFDKGIMSNIETFYTNYLQNEEVIKIWQNLDVNLLLDSTSKQPPPLVIETYLDLINLELNQNLYIKKNSSGSPLATSFANNNDQITAATLVCKGGKKSEVVLERWLLELDASDSTPDALHFNTYDANASADSSLEQFISDKFLIFLRYLVSLLKVLPAQELYERLINEEKTGKFPSIKVCTRILDGSKPILSKGRIGLSKPIITSSESHLEQKNVIPLETDLGLLRVNVSYRRNVNFFVADQQQAAIAIASQKQHKLESSSHPTGQPTSHISLYNSPVFHQTSSESFSSLLSAEQHIGSAGRKSLNSFNSNINRGSLQYQQNFKVGSVGSIASNTLTRNPSNSSVIATLRAQRSSNGSNNGLSNTVNHSQNQYQLSNDFISSPSASENIPVSFTEQIKKRPSFKGERKSSKSEVHVHMNKNPIDLSENNPEVKEFLDLISDEGSKSNSMLRSSSLITSNYNNNWNNLDDKSKVQSITDSLMRFKMMKSEPGGENNNTSNFMSMSMATTPDSNSVAKRKDTSSSSIYESDSQNNERRKYSSNNDELTNLTDENQFGFSPTRGFDAEQLKATLERSRRGSLDSSRRMALSTSRNSLYSHYEKEHEEEGEEDEFIPGFTKSFSSSANEAGITGSFSSVTSPRDILIRRKRRMSSSSSYSVPKFSHSITSNKMSGSPLSNNAISYSSQNPSRRSSSDHYAEPTTETATVYANFEKPRSYSRNSNSSIAATRGLITTISEKNKKPLDNEHASTDHDSINKDSEVPTAEFQNRKITQSRKNSSNNKHHNSSLNDDDDDLLFFMGDSS